MGHMPNFIADVSVDFRTRKEAIRYLVDKEDPDTLVSALLKQENIDSITPFLLHGISEVGTADHLPQVQSFIEADSRNIITDVVFSSHYEHCIKTLESKRSSNSGG